MNPSGSARISAFEVCPRQAVLYTDRCYPLPQISRIRLVVNNGAGT